MALLLPESFVYELVDLEFYETLNQFRPDEGDYIAMAKRRLPGDWSFGQHGVWYYCTPPNATYPAQGWKIHLSATAANSPAVLAMTCRVMERFAVAFKFNADRRIFLLLNSKNWSRGGSGKFVTVYPRDEAQCGELLEALREALVGFAAPLILSDQRYRDSACVHYRYGGISPVRRLTVRGEFMPIMQAPDGVFVDDERQAFFVLPPGVIDPFAAEGAGENEEEEGEPTLKNGRYRIDAPIAFSSGGGIYRATDLSTRADVIIKEARPHAAQSAQGTDAVWALKKEHRLLTLLQGEKVAPAPIDFFQDWEHYYLVQEFIPGATLRAYTAHLGLELPLRPNPTLENVAEFMTAYRRVYRKVAQALQVLHDHGVVFSDLSHYNVMVLGDGEDVRLIDFGGAHEIGVDVGDMLFTPGFVPRQAIAERASRPEDDRYALGGLMVAALMPVNDVLAINPDGYLPLLRASVADLGFPEEIARCIRALLDPDRAKRPELAEVILVLSADHPLATPEVGTAEVEAEDLELLLRRMVSYIESTADYARDDRLFPGGPMLYETNPLSVANGACGVAYALHRITGSVRPETMEWILRHPVTPELYPPGLYAGSAGIAWVLLELGRREEAEQIMQAAFDHPLRWSSPDLFNGVAGSGMALLRFHLATGDEEYLRRAGEAGRFLLETRQREDGRSWWITEGEEYSGIAHGTSGICLFLLYLALATGDDAYMEAGREGMDHVLGRATRNPEGGLSWFVQEGHTTYTPYWRWGSAGVGIVLLRYWAVLGDVRYRDALADVRKDVDRKFSIFPGLHLGLTGMCEFFLDLADFGEDHGSGVPGVLKPFAGLLHFKLEREAGVAFPGESRSRISCDYATGTAGVALFIHRYLHGGQPAFMLDELLGDMLAGAGPLPAAALSASGA